MGATCQRDKNCADAIRLIVAWFPLVVVNLVFWHDFNIVIRLAFASPMITEDSKFFVLLADNMNINHCYSVSNLQLAECKPSWGSQPPGYPVFIALVRRLVGTDPLQVVFAQTTVFALAAATALWAFYSWHKSVAALLGSLLMLAFSPVSVAWPRWVLTETLAAAAGLWVFAALFRSLGARRMRVITAALAIAGATLVRWDQIWLLVPASLCAFYLGGSSKGLRDTAAMGFIAALPFLAMIARAALVGLPLLPSMISDAKFARGGVVAILNLIWQRAEKIWTGKDAIFSSGWSSLPSAQMAENLCHVYRMVLILSCLSLLLLVRGAVFVLVVGLLSYVALRTIFLASLTALEIRYLMPMFPVMEIVLASLVFGVIGRTRTDQV
jgi:hypothetical protein